jgi:cell division transport system ATP-binding protein
MKQIIDLDQSILLDIRDAEISYDETAVLSNVNMQISAGEFCYLIGKTGSGKSALLKTLYGELRLNKGYGNILETDLKELNHKNKHLYRRKIGIIFQEYFLFKSMNVYENLDYILRALSWQNKDSRNERIKQVLIEVGLIKKIYSKTYELSGGEQQRVNIARALINNPSVLMADEPTGNLDVESADELMYLIQNISYKYKTAVLFATHDNRITEKFPARSYKCEAGAVIDLG